MKKTGARFLFLLLLLLWLFCFKRHGERGGAVNDHVGAIQRRGAATGGRGGLRACGTKPQGSEHPAISDREYYLENSLKSGKLYISG